MKNEPENTELQFLSQEYAELTREEVRNPRPEDVTALEELVYRIAMFRQRSFSLSKGDHIYCNGLTNLIRNRIRGYKEAIEKVKVFYPI